jgi:hypothetical protein
VGDDRFSDAAADSSVDALSGGAGRDTFVISMNDQALSAAAEDVITDFTVAPAATSSRSSTRQAIRSRRSNWY